MRLAAACLLVLVPALALAATVQVDTTTTTVFGYQVSAGDTIIIKGPERARLSLIGIAGEDGNPVIVRNELGVQVLLSGRSTSDNCLALQGCSYIRITGTGGGGTYGLRFEHSTGKGIHLYKTTNVEVDHLEIANVGGPGLLGHTEYTAGDSLTWRSNFTQYDTHIHHNYVHDTGTEGLYIGSTTWSSGLAPVLRGLSVHDNLIERTGWDGVQISSAVEDVAVYDNIIRDPAEDNYYQQNHGLIIQAGSVGDYYGNQVIDCTGVGVRIDGAGALELFNNLVAGSGDGGMYWAQGQGHLYFNTVVESATYGISVSSAARDSSSLHDNIAAGHGTSNSAIYIASTSGVTGYNNLTNQTVTPMYFRDAGSGDYHLTASSPARNSGSTSSYPAEDIEGHARPYESVPDKGAFEYRPDPNPDPDPDPELELRISTSRSAQGGVEFLFAVKQAGPAKFEVFDLRGGRVLSRDLGTLTEGEQRVSWSGRDDAGRSVASGVYLGRVVVGQRFGSARITLVR